MRRPARRRNWIIEDYFAGENDRKKVEDWLPNYMGFPLRAYTKNGGIRIEDARSKIKGLIKGA